jgi:flavin-dependent dehydrogenase
MSTTDHDVVVVGADPVGLSLALGLARDERSVLVLEKEPGTSEHSRPPIMWPRTQEGLSEGTRVVTHPGEQLSDGTRVAAR